MNENNRCAVCGKTYLTEADFLAGTSRWRLCQQENLWFNCSCGSTIMIKKGKYPWYSPAKLMSDEARGIFNTLGNLKDMPHFPTSVMQLQQLLLKQDVAPKEVGMHLRRDPVMAAQVLQIAENIRNARNPSNPKITALEHAIVYIGFRPLSDLIMTAALRSMPLPKEALFDAGSFWSEAYMTGVVAEFTMRRFKIALNPDEVFLAGSLANIGKLVTVFCFPPLAAKLDRAVSQPPDLSTWRQAEKSYSFPDHCILGEIASTLWGFPEYIMQATRLHHDVPSTRRTTHVQLPELVAFANQMVHWVLLRPHRMEYDVIRGFEAKQGISEADVETLARDLIPIKRQIESDPVFHGR